MTSGEGMGSGLENAEVGAVIKSIVKGQLAVTLKFKVKRLYMKQWMINSK